MANLMNTLFSGQGAQQVAANNGINGPASVNPAAFGAIQGGNVNQAGGQAYSNAQQQLLSQLQGQASGASAGPNLAQLELQQATQGNIAQQAGLAASQRGNQNPGMLESQLAQGTGQANQAAADQAAQVAGTQQLAAQQALAGLAGTGLNQAATQAGMNQATNQFNSQSQQSLAGLTSANQNSYNQLLQALYGSQLGAQGTALGGLFSGLGSLGSFGSKSDVRSKQDILPGDEAVRALLSGISAKTYTYKDPTEPGAAPGPRLGIIAQDLEKAGPIGEGLVVDTLTGKMIDGGQAIGAILASLAMHHRKLEELENARS